MSEEPDLTEDELEAKAIAKLEGRDKVGVFGDAAGVLGGTAAGATAAGTVAGVAGASTLLGSTTLASVFGGVFVAATPVGWVIGAAAVGGLLGLAVTKLVRSGGRNDERRESTAQRLRLRARQRANREAMRPTDMQRLDALLERAVQTMRISREEAGRMRAVVQDGRLPHALAIDRITALLEA
jgi:hypothetical protein